MIEIPGMQIGYVILVEKVLIQGRRVAPRGQETYEVPDLIFKMRDPLDGLPLGTGRKLNTAIAAAEAAQLVGAFSDPDLMVRVSPTFAQFLEDDGQFWGGYGRRVGPQLVLAAQKLTADRDTRQAVITMWDPRRDNAPGKKDYPCTLALVFQIRDDKLELHVTMRSNDIWLGLPYDVFQFTQLQLTTATALGVEPGAYFHHSVSMHLYARDLPAIENLIPAPTVRRMDAAGFGNGDQSIFNVIKRARRIGEGNGESLRHVTPSERWYIDRLAPYHGVK